MKQNKAAESALDMWKALNKFYCWYNLSFSSYKMEFILFHLTGCENIDLYNPLVIISALAQKTPWFLKDALENRES